MGLRINTNIISLKAQRNLGKSVSAMNRALERLASGSRVNNAGDDAAGLAVSEGLRSQIRGLGQAVRNANDGVGFLATAEGALSEMTNISQRIRELAIQAATGSISDDDRGNLNREAQQLIEEFDRIATSTEFNGVFLLDGTFTTTDLQVGTNKGQTISFSIGDARAAQLGSQAVASGYQHNIVASVGVTGLVINGVTISASEEDNVSSAYESGSALAIARAINEKKGSTKVTADALENVVSLYNLDFSNFSGTMSSGDFILNGVDITGTIPNINSFIDAVNSQSASTGVKARLKSGSVDDIELTAADGRNIQIQMTPGAAASDAYGIFDSTVNFSTAGAGDSVRGFFLTGDVSLGVGVVVAGKIQLRSSSAITLSTSGGAPSMSNMIGFSSTSVAVSNSTKLSNVNLATSSGAANALSIVDVVLDQITTIRSKLGSIQNRLEATTSNLSVTSENLASAQSQIRDADIAAETAELTKNQILQQAGIAVLGQANVSAQTALQLLRFQ